MQKCTEMKNLKVFILALLSLGSVYAQENNADKALSVATSLEDMYSWNLYPSYQTYLDFMQHYADTYPNFCKLDTIGYSVQNRLLLALKISSNPDSNLNQPKFFYSSTIHGNELTGAMILMHLIDTLLTSNAQDIASMRNSMQMYICPIANPDGTYHGGNNNVSNATRYNANYIDLNRNFPDFKQGAHPDGESYQPETMAFMEYALTERFNIGSNLHTGSEVYNYPFDAYRSAQKTHADKSWFEAMGHEFVNNFDACTPNNYFKDVTTSGLIDGGDWYTVYGGRQDWHTYYAHCREVTLELSMSYTPSNATIANYWNYLHNSMLVLPRYCFIGFEGIVKDSLTNLPIEDVMIEILNHDRDSSEVFSNSNGYFLRPILSGNYSVRFSKEGYFSKTIEVNTNEDLTDLGDILLVNQNFCDESVEQTRLRIYPNPIRDLITIEVEQEFTGVILSLDGRILKTLKLHKGANVLDVSTISSGNYLLKVFNETKQYNKKISVIK